MQSRMIGFITGVVSVGLWPALPGWQTCLLLAGLAAYLLPKKHLLQSLAGGIAVGCLWAIVYGNTVLAQRLPLACVRQPLLVSGQVISLPVVSVMRDSARRQRFELAVNEIAPMRCAGPATILVSYYGDQAVQPGEQWQFEVTLKRPWGLANPGSYNLQSWFAQSGIDGVGNARRSGMVQRLSPAALLDAPHHRLRQRLSSGIGELALSADVKAILRAITVADKSGIDNRLWLLFQTYGISHLLVISGLHVGLVAGAGFVLGSLVLRLSPAVAAAGLVALPALSGLALAASYAALAGFSLPTQRALCMLASFVVANLLGRSSSAANSLLLAAVVVLLLNPLAALGSGFWLSFGAVAALLWLSRWQRGRGRWWRLLSTHGYMALVMLPLGSWFFGGASLVAMLANLIMIPLIGCVIVPLSLLGALSYIGGVGIASQLWELAAWPLVQLLPLAIQVSEAGGDWLFLHLTAGLAAIALGMLAVVLLVLPLGRHAKMLIFVLVLPLVLPHRSGPAIAATTRITVLDVGQGTSVVVRAGGKTLLYDTGGGDPHGANLARTVVLPFLRAQGVTSLDTLVISHPDRDHSAGAAAIVQALPIGRLRYGGDVPDMVSGRPCNAGEAWQWPGGERFQFLSPSGETVSGTNNSSCVLQIKLGEHRLLLAGDIDQTRERVLVAYWGGRLQSDWLLAGHHGSKTSSAWSWLKRVLPRFTVISRGYANRFGHPHPTVLDRYSQLDQTVLDTASGGALTFEYERGKPLQYWRHRDRVRRYWM